MSDDSTAPADLSNIGIDLTQMFRPAWTTETTDTSARLAAKFDEGDRPERRGGDRGRDHGVGRDSRGPRPERGAGSPRPEGRWEGPGQGGRSGGPRREGRSEGRPGGRDRNDRGGSRGREERRPEPVAKPLLEGWKLQLVPEAPAIEGIAKQIRSRAKAYPLFELARLIVQLSDRYSVKLEAEPEKATELFRAKLDDSLWTSRKEAVNHLLAKHLGKFYRSTSVTTEAPKGAFAVVAQCGMSGVLLGPPNHHEYTSKVIALHSSRFKNMPFEVYKSRIRMMRDEALIEQWKTEQSTKTIYIPLTPGEAEGEVVTTQTEAPLTAEVSTPEVSNQEVVESVVAENLPTEASALESAEPAQANEETAPSDAPAADTDTQTDTTSEAEPASEASETPSEKVNEKIEEGFTLQQATAHFIEHHAANEVEPLGKEITLEGRIALHGSTPLLRELLLKNLQEMDRFPLPLAQVVGKELTNRGLQLFKSHKKIINVSVARPRYLDRETSAIGDGFRTILEYLEAHPKQHRDKQWAALLALRTETVETPATEAPVATAATAATEAEGAAVTNAPAAPDEETLKKREQALGADLLWLLHQGHVIDFAMGNLQAATRPAPKQLSKKEVAAAAAAAGATTTTSAEGESMESMESVESVEGVEGIEDATEGSEEEIVVNEEVPASTAPSAAIEPSSGATPAAEPLPESLEPVQE